MLVSAREHLLHNLSQFWHLRATIDCELSMFYCFFLEFVIPYCNYILLQLNSWYIQTDWQWMSLLELNSNFNFFELQKRLKTRCSCKNIIDVPIISVAISTSESRNFHVENWRIKASTFRSRAEEATESSMQGKPSKTKTKTQGNIRINSVIFMKNHECSWKSMKKRFKACIFYF